MESRSGELPPFNPGVKPRRTTPGCRDADPTNWRTPEDCRERRIDGSILGHRIGFDAACDDPRVHNMGPIPDPSPLLASADVLVMATTTETFGRTVYEAMAAGTLAMVTPSQHSPVSLHANRSPILTRLL